MGAGVGVGVGVGSGANAERTRSPVEVKKANDVTSTNSTRRTIKIDPKTRRFTKISPLFNKNLCDAYINFTSKTKKLEKAEDSTIIVNGNQSHRY
jgi:hypothetical protein